MYTSRKTIPTECESTEIANILDVAYAHNAANGITGGLINARNAFAQLLEGPAIAVDDLMERIAIDRRHENVRILRREETTYRQLPDWSMAYSGPWTYVAKRVEPLVGGDIKTDPKAIDDLIKLLVAFANA